MENAPQYLANANTSAQNAVLNPADYQLWEIPTILEDSVSAVTNLQIKYSGHEIFIDI